MKNDENSKLSLEWNVSREISKINYRIHTDTIKEILVPDKSINNTLKTQKERKIVMLLHKKKSYECDKLESKNI